MLTLLIVDDHALFREGLRALLDLEEDFSVIGEASRGSEALQFLEANTPDVILLDLHLPDGNGATFCRQIMGINHSARVLILSAYDDEQEITAALVAGAVALSFFILLEANDKLQGGIAVIPVLLVGLGAGGWLVRVGVRLATERETVTVSPHGLVWERSDAWGEHTDQMPAESIEQIEAQDSGVAVLGEGRMLLLGRRVLPAERQWLCETLRFLMANMPRALPT